MSSEILQPVILGIVQGLGEFLPISSTAHLILVPYFFSWPDPGLAFDVALHFGTLVAVVTYFWKDWINIFKLAFQGKTCSSKNAANSYGNNILWLLAIATIPGILVGYFLENAAENSLRNPLFIAAALAVFGLILYLVDRYFKIKKDLSRISLLDSAIIGLFQAIAVIPGVSRSGVTITAGRIMGIDRTGAARFSFLLSTPIIFGAVVLKFTELIKNIADLSFILAIFFSAASGYLAIKYLLRYVQNHDYSLFFWYRLVLAAVILIFYLS